MKALVLGLSLLATGLAYSITLQATEMAKKVSYIEAKEQCLKENNKLTGKDLQKCIKNAEHKSL